jgi:hypothetical protein
MVGAASDAAGALWPQTVTGRRIKLRTRAQTPESNMGRARLVMAAQEASGETAETATDFAGNEPAAPRSGGHDVERESIVR